MQKNLVEIYLFRNGGDPIFERAKKVNESCDKALQKEVNNIYWNDYKEFIKNLGYLKNYYKKGDTFREFSVDVLRQLGKGNVEEGTKIFNKTIKDMAKAMVEKITTYAEVEPKEVRNIIVVNTLYKPYMGFLFEEYIEELLQREGVFNIEESKELDDKYKIDLLVNIKSYEQYKIGLQLKSYTFETIYRTYKEEYLKGNKKAINEGICRDVFYLLHSDNAELLKAIKILNSKESICNTENIRLFDEPFTVVTEEENLIDELLKVVFELYNKDNKKDDNSIFSFFKKYSEEGKREKEQNFIDFKEKLYKTEKSLLSTPIDVSN